VQIPAVVRLPCQEPIDIDPVVDSLRQPLCVDLLVSRLTRANEPEQCMASTFDQQVLLQAHTAFAVSGVPLLCTDTVVKPCQSGLVYWPAFARRRELRQTPWADRIHSTASAICHTDM
jgi:hypothetical protein